LYVLISLGVFGTLTVAQVIEFGDTALAEAARPVFGDAGFAMMAVAALLATISSMNANIYGAVGLTSSLARTRQFPRAFGRVAIVGGTRGLTITCAAVLLLANLVDLTAIASVGSVVALTIFLMVAIAAMRLRRETGSNAIVISVAIAATVVVLGTFLVDTLQNEPETFVATLGVLALAVVMEFAWSAMRARRDELPAT
ncbi:MAG: amino acid transporter, partial [Ilumatobacteraceae bacterium]